MSDDAKICEKGGTGLLFPQSYNHLNDEKFVAATVYLVLLLWCFLGVSIVADIFMSSIEAVTSKRKVKQMPSGRTLSVRVWNKTVANLTLMALGSSAPEILLSIIELLGNSMYAADLGPSTIVGSAAFNQLVIIAICVSAIPNGQSRTIEEFTVFIVTGFFSVFAYVWLVVIVAGVSKNVVEIWEGVLTFVFFPIMVIIAFLADKGYIKLPGQKQDEESRMLDKIREEALAQGMASDAEEADILAKEAKLNMLQTPAQSRMKTSASTTFTPKYDTSVGGCSIGFMSTTFCRSGGASIVDVDLEKVGDMLVHADILVRYAVYHSSGSVLQTDDVLFEAGHWRQTLRVEVPPSNDPDVYYWVDILSATCRHTKRSQLGPSQSSNAVLPGSKIHVPEATSRAKIRTQKGNSGGRGQIRFKDLSIKHTPLITSDTTAELIVERVGGTVGEIQCNFHTIPGSARPVHDFTSKKGICLFPNGAIETVIEIEINSKPNWEREDQFSVVLTSEDAENLLIVPDFDLSTVTIEESVGGAKPSALMRNLDGAMNLDAIKEGNTAWKMQFVNAFRPVVAEDAEEAKESASAMDWMIHLLALPWKLVFALIPPTAYCGGWLCFVVALMFIGGVTAIIGDLASLAGCSMGWPDKVTAITIVALGTSLPDAFASKYAAVEDSFADNAIGNVTGSNAVNVFLGLGLPWMIASIFWVVEGRSDEWLLKNRDIFSEGRVGKGFIKDGAFIVDSEGLTFSVLLYLVTAVSALAIIVYRRVSFKAELGGPQAFKYLTSAFLVFLWVLYVSLASWSIIEPDVATAVQIGAVAGGYCGVLALMVAVAFILNCVSNRSSAPLPPEMDTAERDFQFYSKQRSFHPQLQSSASFGTTPIEQQDVFKLKGSISNLEKQVTQLQQMISGLERQSPVGKPNDENSSSRNVPFDVPPARVTPAPRSKSVETIPQPNDEQKVPESVPIYNRPQDKE